MKLRQIYLVLSGIVGTDPLSGRVRSTGTVPVGSEFLRGTEQLAVTKEVTSERRYRPSNHGRRSDHPPMTCRDGHPEQLLSGGWDCNGESHLIGQSKRRLVQSPTHMRLWEPGHRGQMGNELADEEAKFGLAEHQPPAALDPADHRALIKRACASTLYTTLLHTAYCTRSSLWQEDVLLSKFETTNLRRFRSDHHPALQRWKDLIN